jgi:hypothetical protein
LGIVYSLISPRMLNNSLVIVESKILLIVIAAMSVRSERLIVKSAGIIRIL